jgi:hypothetical protein
LTRVCRANIKAQLREHFKNLVRPVSPKLSQNYNWLCVSQSDSTAHTLKPTVH